MKAKTFTKVSGVIFLIIAILHLLRLVLKWEAAIGGWSVPMWFSIVALFFAGYLGYQGLRLSR